MKEKEYQEIKKKAYRRYKKIKKIYCPYFKKEIVFNSNGFRHLIYKSGKTKRDKKSQLLRFQFINKAIKLLKITTTLQEYQHEKKPLIIKKNRRRVLRIMRIEHFGFIAIIDKFKIKVIIKKIGQGGLFFWSVIPNWRTRRKERIFFKGNLEKD